MKITSISLQTKNRNRVNVSVDGNYRFSLDVFQVGDLGIKVGKDYTEEELQEFETESQFGKVYTRALEYCLMRPHSGKEIQDYLYRKTRDSRDKNGNVRKGVPLEITKRVFERLTDKGYIDDEKFARFWVDNRHMTKGASQRKLMAELRAKGVAVSITERMLASSGRFDEDELEKVIAKKRARYSDEQKLVQYLMRQGFDYDDIKNALAKE